MAQLARPGGTGVTTSIYSRIGRGVVEMPDQAIVIADKAGVIQTWNAAAEALFGYDATSVIGQTLDLIVPPEYRERHWKGFHAAIEGKNLAIDRASANVPVLCRSGAILRMAVRLLVLRDARQNPVGAMAIFVYDDEADSSLPRL
jgi:PAS domain S-box-containing protein